MQTGVTPALGLRARSGRRRWRKVCAIVSDDGGGPWLEHLEFYVGPDGREVTVVRRADGKAAMLLRSQRTRSS